MFEKLIKYLTRTKFRVILMRKHFDSYFVEKVIVLSKLKKEFSINGKSFSVIDAKPVYFNRNERIFIFDALTGQQLTFGANQNLIEPEILDEIMLNKFVSDAIAGSKLNMKQKWLDYLFGFVIGALLASLIVLLIMQNKIEAIYEEMSFIPILGA